MAWGDFFNSSTIGGLFNPMGGGPIAGYFQHQATKRKQEALGQARLQMDELARSQRAQRMQDLDRAMGFFGPVQAEMARLYGRGPSPAEMWARDPKYYPPTGGGG